MTRRRAAPPTPAPRRRPELPNVAWKRTEGLREPQHVSLSLLRVAEAVGAGLFVLPRFQRKFVWSDAQVCRLFDSVLRGYHVGSLITWDQNIPKQPVDFGGVVVESRGGWGSRVVIDGQQRIGSVARLFWTDRYAVHLLTGELLVEPEPGPWIIPAHLALSVFGRGDRDDGLRSVSPEHVARWGLDRDVFDCLVCDLCEVVCQNFLSVVKLEASYTLEEVVEMFRRLNTEGTRMSAEDLRRALEQLRAA